VTAYLWGDTDGDGYLTANDAAKILSYVLSSRSVNLTEVAIKYSDVDKDGKLTANDASEVLQKVLNPSYKLTVEK
jgi:Ca2+-binding EF-hand superfamily protein